MFKLRTLYLILKQTKADKILASYLLFVFIAAFLILIFDPGITTYGDALWYLYAVISTAGFGDIVVSSFLAKLVSLFVTIYSLIALAILTGVIVNFYNEILENRRSETISTFLDELERLPELSREELESLSKRVHKFRLK